MSERWVKATYPDADDGPDRPKLAGTVVFINMACMVRVYAKGSETLLESASKHTYGPYIELPQHFIAGSIP